MNDTILLSHSVSIDGIPSKIKLMPLGLVKSEKGDFVVDMESFDLIKKHFKGRMLDLVVDYEHQTLDNVQAPAAGWIKDLDITSDGIYGNVEWTPKAQEYLKNKEYKYLSPVVMVRKSDKKAVQLHSIGLTNTPAIDGMTPIVNSLSSDIEPPQEDVNNIEKFIEKLKKILSLSPDATFEDISKKISDILNQNQTLELKINAMQIEAHKKEVNDLVLLAMKGGKLTPPQKEWAERMALKDIDGFKDWLKSAPQIVPMGEMDIEGFKTSPSKNSRARELLGISDDDYNKYLK